jgi:hypothetical protein
MFTCSKCNKEFKFEYEFKRHNNRKIPCNSIKDFNCASCNKSFKYKSKLNEHEKTNKHLLQINKFIVNGNNHIGNNINTNNS